VKRERERETMKLMILEVERCCSASSNKLRGGWKNTSINQLTNKINNNDDGEVSELEI
jgi:hypothetical protein